MKESELNSETNANSMDDKSIWSMPGNKITLTKKQKKSRVSSKLAKKSRKTNRRR